MTFQLILLINVTTVKKKNPVSNSRKKWVPKQGGPIAHILFEHEITKNLTDSIIKSTEVYTSTGQPAPLIKDIEKYIDHVSLHLSKENQRLFAMADMILADQHEALSNNLTKIEKN